MHYSIALWIEQMDEEFGPFHDILEAGSLNVNGTIRDHWTKSVGASYKGIDIVPGPCVDLVANAKEYGDPETYDCVVSTGALEHEENPKGIILNAHRILKDGGRLLVTAAGVGFHRHGTYGAQVPDDGEHYENIEEDSLTEWIQEAGFTGWEVSHHEVSPGETDIRAWAVK